MKVVFRFSRGKAKKREWQEGGRPAGWVGHLALSTTWCKCRMGKYKPVNVRTDAITNWAARWVAVLCSALGWLFVTLKCTFRLNDAKQRLSDRAGKLPEEEQAQRWTVQ